MRLGFSRETRMRLGWWFLVSLLKVLTITYGLGKIRARCGPAPCSARKNHVLHTPLVRQLPCSFSSPSQIICTFSCFWEFTFFPLFYSLTLWFFYDFPQFPAFFHDLPLSQIIRQLTTPVCIATRRGGPPPTGWPQVDIIVLWEIVSVKSNKN